MAAPHCKTRASQIEATDSIFFYAGFERRKCCISMLKIKFLLISLLNSDSWVYVD
jgi:hypothetical protein